MNKIKYLTLTNITIAITIIMYIVQINIDYGSAKLGLNNLFLDLNLWYQPLSTMFAHGGEMHLLMNMFVLYQFGNMIEQYRGKIYFIVLYFIGGVITSLLSFAFMHYLGLNHNLVGASGAICVLMGYIALIDKSQRGGITTWIVLISLAPLLIGLPIAWYAHFIGFAIGFIIGLIRR
jgi:membrane associated rhomboid family serine protease